MYPLTEESPNVFRFPDWGLYHDEKLIFDQVDEGRATKVVAASVPWVRRPLEDGGTFKIKPVRQLDGLRREALAAVPPPEPGEFRKPELVNLATLDPTLKFDIRYATTNNFLSTPFYTTARAFMQKPAAAALLKATRSWPPRATACSSTTPTGPGTSPRCFGGHARQVARLRGRPPQRLPPQPRLRRRSHPLRSEIRQIDRHARRLRRVLRPLLPDYLGGSTLQRWHRELLRSAMEAEGFSVYEAEWWHFDYRDWRQYPILNLTFEQLGQK